MEKVLKLDVTQSYSVITMKRHPAIAQIDNRWRARRVLKRLWLSYPEHSAGRRYYEAIFDATFFIA
jgi:hypothetical protein